MSTADSPDPFDPNRPDSVADLIGPQAGQSKDASPVPSKSPKDREEETVVTRIQSPNATPNPSTEGSLSEGSTVSLGTLPKQLGDYQLLEEVDRGGMGVVFRAFQTSLNRVVAVKIIRAGQFADAEDVQRFQSEAEAAAKLHHPAIVPIYEVGEWNGNHYFSMAFIEGSTLARRIKKGPLNCREAAEYLAQIAEAVQCAHDHGVVHRDLKPSNILINDSKQALVTDFGLAKRTDSDSHLTGTGQIIGTPNYMSPEQASALGDEVGPISDVYSMGAILYCLVTGRAPFHAANVMRTLRQVISQDPVAPKQLNGDVDSDLETICLQCLEKDPSSRYASAQDLADDLRRYLDSEKINARPVSRLAKIRRWRRRNSTISSLILALAACAIMLIAVSAVLILQFFEQRSKSDEISKQRGLLVRDLQSEVSTTEDQVEKERRVVETSYVDRAERAFLSDGPVSALPFYAASLRSEYDDPEYGAGHWTRITWILQTAPRPVNTWTINSETFSSDVSPDGTYVAAAGRDGTIHVWNRKLNKAALRSIETNLGTVSVLEFTPNSKKLIIGVSRTLRIIDIASGSETMICDKLPSSIRSVALFPWGKHIVVGMRDGSVVRFKTSADSSFDQIAKHKTTITRLDISPKAPTLLATSDDGSASLVDLRDNREIASLEHEAGITWGGFSPDGNLVVTVSEDGLAKIWDPITGEQNGEPLVHGDRIRCAAFSGDGARLATGGWDKKARIWSLKERRQLTEPLTHDNSIPRLSFSPDDRFLVTASLDHTARVWDTQTGEEATSAMQHGFILQNVEFLPDGKHVMTASADRTVRIWSLNLDPDRGAILRQDVGVRAIDISNDGQTLLVADDDGLVTLVDSVTGEPTGIEVRHSDRVNACIFSFDGKAFATASQDGRARVWRTEDGTPLTRWLTHDGGEIFDIHLSKDGQYAVTAGQDKLAKIWNVRSSELKRTLKHKRSVRRAMFSGDGLSVLTCGDNKEARIWSSKTGLATTDPMKHDDRIENCCFSPDGRYVATASNDHSAQIWDAKTGRTIGAPLEHSGGVHTIEFSKDSTLVLTGGRDGCARLWEVPTGKSLSVPMSVCKGLVRATFSKNEEYIAIACGQGASLFEAESGRLLMTGLNHSTWVTGVQFNPQDLSVISFGEDGTVRRWQIPEPLDMSVDTLSDFAELISGQVVQPNGTVAPVAPSRIQTLVECLQSTPLD